jgi:hypothetical protein
MDIRITSGIPADSDRWPEMYWLNTGQCDVAVRRSALDGLWYSTDKLCSSMIVLFGPYPTKDAALAATEMLVQSGMIKVRKETT